MGVLKAAVGLSGSLFAMVYTGAFAPDKHSFLLFLALAPAVVGLAAAPFINHCSFVQQSELQAGQHVFTAGEPGFRPCAVALTRLGAAAPWQPATLQG